MNDFTPTAEWIDSLQAGDLVPNCFGQMAEIVTITCKQKDIKGRLYVCLYTRLSKTSTISGSFKEGERMTLVHPTGIHQDYDALRQIAAILDA
jgi:hypothetical protein